MLYQLFGLFENILLAVQTECEDSSICDNVPPSVSKIQSDISQFHNTAELSETHVTIEAFDQSDEET